MQKSNTTVIYIFERQVLRHYFRIVTVDLYLATVANRLPIDKFIQGKERKLQRLYPLTFSYVELNLVHMLLISLLEANESLLLLRFDQLITRPLQNTQTCIVLLQRSPYLGVHLLSITHWKHTEIRIWICCHYYPATLIMHRYDAHSQGQGRTQGSSTSTFDFADGYFGNIKFLNSAITKILLILPASFVHIFVFVKINRLFLVRPLLVTQLPLLNIHRYFLLPGPFEDVHHIAEEYKTHPIVNFLWFLCQHLQIMLYYCIQQHYFGYLLLAVFGIFNYMRKTWLNFTEHLLLLFVQGRLQYYFDDIGVQTLLGLGNNIGVATVFHVVEYGLVHGSAVINHEEYYRRRYFSFYWLEGWLQFFSMANL